MWWLISPILLVLAGVMALAQWALPKFRPSALARYPGGIAEFRRRGRIVIPLYVVAGLVMGGLTSGNRTLGVIALVAMYGGPLVAVGVMVVRSVWKSRSRRRGKTMSPAEAQEFHEQWRQKQAAQRQEVWQRQLKALIFPYELVPGAQAEAAFEAARTQGLAEGYSALIITPDSPLPTIPREPWMAATRRILEAEVDAQAFFAERRAEMSKYDDVAVLQMLDDVAASDAIDPPLPDYACHMSSVRDVRCSGPPLRPFAETALVRIPTPRNWEIPAYTLFGAGGIGFPSAEQMVAVARYWHEKYGADVCAIGTFALEFRIARPPAQRREAVALLREHVLFSPLDFEQFVGDPEMLRDRLQESIAWLPRQTYWVFGWEL